MEITQPRSPNAFHPVKRLGGDRPGWRSAHPSQLACQSKGGPKEATGWRSRRPASRRCHRRRQAPDRARLRRTSHHGEFPVTNRQLPQTDGRRQRSARTRQRLIEAYLELLEQHPNGPTSARIAEQAGCSQRSVYQHFPDLRTLGLAAADHAWRLASAQAGAREVDSDRLSRIRSEVETRSAACDQWLPLWRSMLRNQHDSGELLRRVEWTRDTMLARLELMYQPELSARSEGERREVLIALEALTDFETWARMRQRHGLSVKAAREVWINAIDRILPPTPWPEQRVDAAIDRPAEAGASYGPG